MKHYYFFMILLVFGGNAYSQTPSYVPNDGLVAWWGFNGDYLDQSGNANHLVSGGSEPTSVVDRFGTVNSALEFDGFNTYLTKSNLTSQFAQSGSFSFSIWVKKDNTTDGVVIMSGSAVSDNFIWLLQTEGSSAVFGTNKQNSSWVWVNGPDYDLSVWDHYVSVYSSGEMTFYKNGLSEGTSTNSYNANTADLPLWIGKGFGGGYINANIDDVGIWNRAITSDEVMQLYQSTLGTSTFVSKGTQVFPNPFTDNINFTFADHNVGDLYNIYDALGRNVYSGSIESQNTTINLSTISNGIYFLKINTEVSVSKFVKN